MPSVPVRFVQSKRSFDLPFHRAAASAAPTHVFAAATTTPFPRQRHHHRKPSIGATADLVGKEGTCCWCAIFTHLCESSPPVSQPVHPPWRRNTTHQHDELQRALSASPTLSIFTKTVTQPSTYSPPHHTTTKRLLPLSSGAVRPPPLAGAAAKNKQNERTRINSIITRTHPPRSGLNLSQCIHSLGARYLESSSSDSAALVSVAGTGDRPIVSHTCSCCRQVQARATLHWLLVHREVCHTE